MPPPLAACFPYIPPLLASSLVAHPTLVPMQEALPAAVLFADLAGFTPLTEALAHMGDEGPEAMTRLLNACLSQLIAAIEAEGGEVVKFSGDAVTALFPARTSPLGHVVRHAVQAAAAMHALLAATATVPGSVGPASLAVKIGIGAGQVQTFRVGGVLARWEYVVAGDPLRQVADAERAAQPGETRLSPEAAVLLADATIPASLPPPPRPALVLPPGADLDVITAALQGFIPGAIRGRLEDALHAWNAELRPMSVLFLGVSGLEYTASDALARLHRFCTTAQEAIYHYEGSLNKLAVDDKGTILLAMFGAPPLAHADDAARATHAARDILRLSTAQGVATAIGIATGPVFAGPVGSPHRREYTVMGDTVNRAARLMAAAGPGDIRCDGATARDARRVLAFEALPPVHLKGKADVVRVYRPMDLHASSALRGTPLIGRQAEVQRLTAVLDAVQAGQSRLLAITGEAGVGKSRLLDEGLRLGQAHGWTILRGAGSRSARQTPYQAWRAIAMASCGIQGLDDPEQRQQLVQTQVMTEAPSLVARLALLNDLLGTAFPETPSTTALSPGQRQQGRATVLIELLRALTSTHPLLLVLEDAHWLDTGSWDLALAVAQGLRTAGRPYALILTLRPLTASARPAALNALLALDGAESLTVAALPPHETVALAAALLGLSAPALPAAVADLIRARAAGNPFCAEEILLALRDQGVLEVIEEGGQRRCLVHGDVTAATHRLPQTVQGIVLARLDQLPPAEQMLLRVGAVIGPRFSYHTLRAVLTSYLPLADTELKARLTWLATLDLTPEETPDPDLRHAFKNIITRDVTYGTMLFTQRRELHRLVAAYYEQRFALDGPGLETGEDPTPIDIQRADVIHRLAYHYQQAEDQTRERHYATLAGALAAASGANTEALAYLERALALTPPEAHALRRRLLRSREQVYDVLGQRQDQAADLAALAALSDPQDPRAQAELIIRQAHYAFVTDDFPRALALAAQATALARRAAWPEGETLARHHHGAALIPLARYAEASAHLTHALTLARRHGFTGIEDDCLRDLGLIASHQGDYATARTAYEQALALDRAIGDRRGESATLVRLAAIARELGDSPAALHAYEQALALDRATGDRDNAADALRGIGLIAYDRGDYLAARHAYEASLASERATSDREGQAACLAALGMTARALGEWSTAQRALEQALAITQAIGDQRAEATVRADLALVCHQYGENDLARGHAAAAYALATALGVPAVAATALTRLGHALHRLGDLEAAASAYQEALHQRRALGLPTLALEPLAGLTRLALAQGEVPTAQRWVEELVQTLHVGSNAWLDELPPILLCCYQVLRAAHDPRAAQVLATAYAHLERQAAQIDDPAHRQAFWDDVPAHRALRVAYHTQRF